MNSTVQPQLFHDSIDDAIGSAIASLGGFKKVGGLLWPSLSISAAEARVRACLNPERDNKFSADEILTIARLARVAGDHSIMQYLAGELGYGLTVLEPDDERNSLDRQIAEQLQTLNKLLGHRDRKFGPLTVAK